MIVSSAGSTEATRVNMLRSVGRPQALKIRDVRVTNALADASERFASREWFSRA